MTTLPKEPVTSLIAEVSWNWKNFDGTEASSSSLVELQGQLAEIDWEPLALEEPYSLEPVSSEKTLVGRSEVLAQLVAKASGSSVGSACLTGQRRVGKTSIAKTLKSRLVNELGSKIIVLFIEAGEYVHPEAKATIEKLGTKLCKQIILSDKRLTNVTRPVFDGALSPITDFFDECLSIIPDIRIVIILDEFDSVPPDLYRRGPTGEAFFSTIRSLSQKGNVGFILIGGERMRYLTDCQGQALNKFQIIRVDYFDRSRYWTDYQELITRPTRHCLQFTDSALQYIYTMSAGNPYYTILICRSLFNLMVSRRDSHITERDAMEGVAQAIREASTTSFQHFWEDGIVAAGAEMEDISMRRRFVLLALAEAHRGKKSASRDEIAKAAEIYGLDARSVENELSEFVQREILISTNGQYHCKVPLFSSWLQSVGPRQISTTYTEAEAVRILRQREDDSEVHATEIVKLVETWQPYKGRRISAEDVRGWLDQFGRKSDQRLMFRILENVRFFSDDEVREWMRVAQGIVTRGLVDRVAHKQVKRWQSILVGYLDGPAKSGSYLAKLYVDENGMFADCVTEKGQIVTTLSKRDDIQALVFVDDYVGTGKSACDYVDEMIDKCKAVLLAKKIRLFFLAVAGTEVGIQKLEEHIAQSGVNIQVHVNVRLGATDICFGTESRVFPDPNERLRAQEVAERIGQGLCRRDPLGFSNSQATVVFSHNCPNNSLPILWERSANWIPLFRRD